MNTQNLLAAARWDRNIKNKGIKAKCERCQGTGKRLLPSLVDWKTYMFLECSACDGSGQWLRRYWR